MVQILICAAALVSLSARPAAAGAPSAARCEPSSAAAAGDAEAFWNTAYVVPEYDGSHTLLLSTSNPTAVEAAVTTMLWKAGGIKMGADPMRSWAQPLRVGKRQLMIPSQMLDCSYRGTWEMAPRKLTGVLKKLFETNAIELYTRQPNKPSFDRTEAARKLAMLDRERPALVADGTAIPSILGLTDAERHSLRALLDRYEAFKRTSRLDLCIKGE